MKSTLRLVGAFVCFLATCVEGIPLIEGGAFASPRELEYAVGIGHFSETGDPSICGGGIIDEKYVLTAAHCVTEPIEENMFESTLISEFRDWWVFVFANTMNFQDDLRKSMEESRSGLYRTNNSSNTRRVVKAYILSKFLTNGVDDIAVLELESPLNLNDGQLRKLDLPSRDGSSYEGELAVLAGFGEDKGYLDTSEAYQYAFKHGLNHVNDGSLKIAHFRIVPNSRCSYGSKDETNALYKHNTLCMVAVTEDNEHPDHPLGACGGDSGSPLVHGNTVIGIMMGVSYYTCDGREASREAGQWRFTQSSMKVEYYKDFINNVVGNRHGYLGNDQTITEYEFRA